MCVGIAGFYWLSPSCPVPALVLLDVALLGLAGVATALLHIRGYYYQWGWVIWCVCGGLAAATIIGVWSFAPWALLAVAAFVSTALLQSRWQSLRMRTTASTLAVSAAVNFVLLFPVAKHSGIEVVEVPAGSLVEHIFPAVDYADAYRARLPAGREGDLESVTRVVLASLYPCWTSRSRRDKALARLRDFAFQPGTSMGWRVYERAADEILMGLDESHLNFRVSIFLREDSGAQRVTVSTVVHYNNWRGRAYFVPVRVGHQIIVPHVVRTAIRNIHETGSGGASESPYQVLEPDLAALRQRFNADADHVRVLMLLSPT